MRYVLIFLVKKFVSLSLDQCALVFILELCYSAMFTQFKQILVAVPNCFGNKRSKDHNYLSNYSHMVLLFELVKQILQRLFNQLNSKMCILLYDTVIHVIRAVCTTLDHSKLIKVEKSGIFDLKIKAIIFSLICSN